MRNRKSLAEVGDYLYVIEKGWCPGAWAMGKDVYQDQFHLIMRVDKKLTWEMITPDCLLMAYFDSEIDTKDLRYTARWAPSYSFTDDYFWVRQREEFELRERTILLTHESRSVANLSRMSVEEFLTHPVVRIKDFLPHLNKYLNLNLPFSFTGVT